MEGIRHLANMAKIRSIEPTLKSPTLFIVENISSTVDDASPEGRQSFSCHQKAAVLEIVGLKLAVSTGVVAVYAWSKKGKLAAMSGYCDLSYSQKVEGSSDICTLGLVTGFRNSHKTASHSQGRKGSVMYKSQLQEYAQKAAIPPPVYEFVKEGASHEPRFKAIVILNNVQYESPPGFPNLKSAEHAAAKAALDGLLQTTGGTGVTPSPVHESGLCKNLLQEYAQKNSLPLPVYQSQRSGEDHAPTFTSSVEIAGVKYSGGSAKNKKEAEIKAARTALLAIQSALSSPVPAPEPAMNTAPQPQVGLATYISTNLHNAPGKKRGRGATNATADEPVASRLKTGPQASQASQATPAPEVLSEVPVNAVTQPITVEMTEAPVNLVTSSVPEVQEPSITSPVKFSSVDIADLFATPGAKKILGVGPKLPQTESSYPSSQEACLLSPGQTTSSPSLLEAATANINMDIQGQSNTTENRIAEEVTTAELTVDPEVQIDLVNGTAEAKEDQAFLQAAQSSGLISLTG